MNATTCNYSSFVLLATAPCPRCAKSHSFRPVWWLEPYQQPHLPTPLPALPLNHPLTPLDQPLVRGFEGPGRISAAWESPQGGKGALGVAPSQQATNNDATKALARPSGPWAHCVPCRERAVPPPRVLSGGGGREPKPKKNKPHQKHALPDSRLQFLPTEECNSLLSLVLALNHAFLQCIIYMPSALSGEVPVQCQERCRCCCHIFLLSWDWELPWGTTHLCASTWGRSNPKSSW